jgi:hypothetical protein
LEIESCLARFLRENQEATVEYAEGKPRALRAGATTWPGYSSPKADLMRALLDRATAGPVEGPL